MGQIVEIPLTGWDQPCSSDEQAHALRALESGSVLLLPHLAFDVRDEERRLLTPAIGGDGKNISLAPHGDTVRGCRCTPEEHTHLHAMMSRFAEASHALLNNLFPPYAAGVQRARTSFRPVEIAGRTTSWRKDDTRLHVDSFPSSPTHGSRILRVFSNINPAGQVRTWRLGEPFEDVVRRQLPFLAGPLPGAGYVLERLGITKGRRTDYDHFMLKLHDRMKADRSYQNDAPQSVQKFAAGCTWIVFTDQVSHAAIGGQHALEQTFLLPLQCLQHPSMAPLRVLERATGRALI
jgi:hypothetical protein